MESSVRSISRPVIDRLPVNVNQLDEFACRQLDRVSVIISLITFFVLSFSFPWVRIFNYVDLMMLMGLSLIDIDARMSQVHRQKIHLKVGPN